MTMRASLAALGLIAVTAVTGCPDDGNGNGNPRTLWLAPDGLEIYVKLVAEQPPPF
jgi:hypothetical protein